MRKKRICSLSICSDSTNYSFDPQMDKFKNKGKSSSKYLWNKVNQIQHETKISFLNRNNNLVIVIAILKMWIITLIKFFIPLIAQVGTKITF